MATTPKLPSILAMNKTLYTHHLHDHGITPEPGAAVTHHLHHHRPKPGHQPAHQHDTFWKPTET